jgi:glycosyltransferase involved in cell wall biosynthesis
VRAKIDSQVRSLSVLGRVQSLVLNRSLVDKVRERLPMMGCDLRAIRDAIVEPDFLYVRKWSIDRQTLEFFHGVKAAYPRCSILLEVPTYPYDSEMIARPKDIPLLAKDRRYRQELSKYVDRVVTFCDQREIFGIPTIVATNGIDVDSVRVKHQEPKELGRIDLIAVATMIRQHGYDRVLRGMADYYGSAQRYRVKLHLVGDGPELRRYRAITRRNGLGDHVVFHGSQSGEALDHLYDYCDMGLVAFGMHRVGVDRVSALKSREYLARGIPMVGGCPIDIFEGIDFPYYLEFPNDDSKVPIPEVVRFYEETAQVAADTVTTAMRQHAYASCDMPIAMAPVIEYLGREVVRR